MCTKQQLKHFLRKISKNAEFAEFNYISPEKYTIIIKCQVENDRKPEYYSALVTEWIKKFSIFTKTAWIVRNSSPKTKRFLYMKNYVCHQSSFNKKQPTRQAGACDKDCRAKINFKMKFNCHTIRRNDPKLKQDLNLNIFIDFSHTHGLRMRNYNQLKKISPETNRLFYKYFESGHSVCTAKSYHELTLVSKHGAHIEEYLSNSCLNPTLTHIHYLYRRKRKEYKKYNKDHVIAERMKVIEEGGGVLRYTNGYSVTVVITPFMKNVLTAHNLDCIIIDSTPIANCVVSFFFVPSPLGALPIACALHSEDTERSYSQAFFSTKLLIESQTHENFKPNKILINLIPQQNYALETIFHNKSLCVFRASMVEEIWKVICDIDSKNELEHRHELLASFHSLLHASNAEEVKYYNQLQSDKCVKSEPKLQEYLIDIWKKREGFMSQTKNKYIDISLHTLKRFLQCRCYTFNSVIMIDVLLNVLDNHWCKILQAHLKGDSIIDTYTKFLPKDKTVEETFVGLKMPEIEYKLVTSFESGKSINIQFRTDTMCCDCWEGRKGQLCEHLSAVLNFVELTTYLPEDKRLLYTAIASEDVEYGEIELKGDAKNDEKVIQSSNVKTNEKNNFIIENEPLENHQNKAKVIANFSEIEDVSELNTTEKRVDCVNSMENEENNKKHFPLDISMSKKDRSVKHSAVINDKSINTMVKREESVENSTGIKDDSVQKPLEIDVGSMKPSYENAMRALNTEFLRLKKIFKDNPSVSNLDTMRHLARELSKIKPEQKVNLSKFNVELNGPSMDCDE